MTLPRFIDFVTTVIVSSEYLNRLQEMFSGMTYNMKPVIQSPTSIRVPGGVGPGNAALLTINGEMRYNEANADLAFSGGDAADTYGIFAITGTDPAFTLTKVQGAGTPGVADYRKIATVDWSGTALSNLVYNVDLQVQGIALVDSSITQAKLADVPIIGTSRLIDDSVTAAKLAADAVDTAAIQNLSVTAAKIAAATITSDKFAPGAVGGATVEDGSITSAKIADGAIVNVDVNAAAAITYGKLNLGNSIVNADVASAAAIARSKLDFGSGLVNADIASGAAIAKSKLASLAVADADVASGAEIAVAKLADGAANDVLVTDTDGTTVIWKSGLTNSHIASGAAIAKSKLASLAIVNADVDAAAAIAYSKLNLSNSIVAGDIAADAVGSSEIASKAVGGAELADALRNRFRVAGVLTFDPNWAVTPTSVGSAEFLTGASKPDAASWGNVTSWMILSTNDVPPGLSRQWQVTVVGVAAAGVGTQWIQVRDAFRPTTVLGNYQAAAGTVFMFSFYPSGDVYTEGVGEDQVEITLFQGTSNAGTNGHFIQQIMVRYRFV